MNIEKKQSVALIVGAGAVQNAWEPIIRALQPLYFKNKLTIHGATSVLTRLVYVLRFFSDNQSDDAFKTSKQLLKSAKERICEEIKISQQNAEITVWKEFYNLINQIILSDFKQFMVVSTNWDTVIEDAINCTALPRLVGNRKIAAIHIHGEYKESQNIYLPSESTEEPYRTKEERQYFGKRHVIALRALDKAHTIILYGLSISPLDAELGQILGACLERQNIKRVLIVDLCPEAVAERVNLLLNYSKDISVHGYHPSDLTTLKDYSLH
jgi:hypothetical protein